MGVDFDFWKSILALGANLGYWVSIFALWDLIYSPLVVDFFPLCSRLCASGSQFLGLCE